MFAGAILCSVKARRAATAQRLWLQLAVSVSLAWAGSVVGQQPTTRSLPLPAPGVRGTMSVEEALVERRSTREFGPQALSLTEASQLLWAAQGVTDPRGWRTAPSAGALFPLEIYLVAARVSELPAGVYRYDAAAHRLLSGVTGDRLSALAEAARQPVLREAPLVVVIVAVEQRSAQKYGDRAARYVAMETGHAAQNVYLQATALRLATVAVGAFDDNQVGRVLELPPGQMPLVLMPIGHRR